MKIIQAQQPDAIDIACDFLNQGKIIAFATETVYGLACDATNEKAVTDLYQLKQRDYSKPFVVFLKDLDVAQQIFIFDDLAHKIAQKYLPGPLTMVLPKQKKCSIKLANNLNLNDDNFLSFRISDNDFIKKLANKYKSIMAVTSANLSGKDAAISDIEVKNIFANSALPLLICNGKCLLKTPSTIVKCNQGNLQILRQGTLTIDEII